MENIATKAVRIERIRISSVDNFIKIVLHVTTPLYLFSSVAVSISACSKYKGKFSAKQLILSIFIDFL